MCRSGNFLRHIFYIPCSHLTFSTDIYAVKPAHIFRTWDVQLLRSRAAA